MPSNEKTGGNDLLKGYKKVKKTFIPPLRQISCLDLSCSYVIDIFPELFWIALLNKEEGYAHSAKILKELFVFVDGLRDKSAPADANFAFCSTYQYLDSRDKEKLKEFLHDKFMLRRLQGAIAPLVILYPEFPLKFIGTGGVKYNEEKLLERLHDVAKDTINNNRTPGVALCASPLMFLLFNDLMTFSDQYLKRGDPNSVIENLDSPEAAMFAGTFRNLCLMTFQEQEFDKSWRRSFWDKNLELFKCNPLHIGESYVR